MSTIYPKNEKDQKIVSLEKGFMLQLCVIFSDETSK